MANKHRSTENDTIKKQALIKSSLLAALEKSLGIVTKACKAVGISRNVYYEYLNSDPDFKAAVKELENVSFDFVESALFKQIQNDSTAATIFYLKTKGRERGYVEKLDMTSNGNTISLPAYMLFQPTDETTE